MAKLKIREGGIKFEASIPAQEEKVEAPKAEKQEEIIEQVMKEHEPTLDLLRLSELDDKMDEMKLNAISMASGLQQKLDELDDHRMGLENDLRHMNEKLKGLERPIVKEIKIDKTNRDDLDALERDILKTVKKLSAERKLENAAMARSIIAGNRLQTAINFILICGLIALTFIK